MRPVRLPWHRLRTRDRLRLFVMKADVILSRMALLLAGSGAGWLVRSYKVAVHAVRCEQ